MAISNLKSKFYSSTKISLIYLIISCVYIIFSDEFILHIFGSTLSVSTLTTIQTYKGLLFVFLTSALLFLLIQREIKAKRKYIQKLELQKQDLLNLTAENEKVKKRLQERNVYIETILKNLPLGIAVNRMDIGTTTFMNKNFSKIYGWPEKDLDNIDSFFEKVYPDEKYREQIKEKMFKAIEDGDPNQMLWTDIEITTGTGKKKIIEVQNIPVFDQNLMISTVRDTTQQNTIEQKVKASEAKFSTLFKMNPTAIVFTRLSDGAIMEVNQAYIDLFGYSKEELINQSTKKISIWENSTQRDLMIETLMQDRFIHDFEALAVRKDGQIIETLSYLQVIDHSGVESIIAIILDITEKKRNEHKIEESRILLEKIINNLDEAVLLVDPKARNIKLANAAVERIFGYSPREIVGKQTKLLHINQEMFEEFGKRSIPKLEKDGVFHTQFQMKHKTGNLIETENTVSTIKEEDGWFLGVVSVIRDITKRKKTEGKLKEYQKSLKMLTTEISLSEEKQRKEIAANIHDHLSQLLVISKMKLTDIQKDTTSPKILDELKAVINYISEALENTRKITYDLSPPVLYELGLIETLYWLAEKTEEEHRIKTTFSSDVNELQITESNLIFIYRIVQELVNNSVKHAHAKKINISLKALNGELEIMISDNGKGFNVKNIPQTKIGKGGFGLFTVRERIQNLNGRISIYSEMKKGTEVKIYIPLE